MQNIFKYTIESHFGSKRGVFRLAQSQFALFSGKYAQFKKIDWPAVQRIVFVCQGNICRSPLGEAVARARGVTSCSCGLLAPNGDPADPRAIAFAANQNLNLTKHKTQHISEVALTKEDLVVAMEPSHVRALQELPLNGAQLTLLGLWLERPRPYIHDPYNTTSQYFTFCEEMIAKGAASLTDRYHRSRHSETGASNQNG